MPTIISGLDPKARMDAYLAGERSQRELMARQEQAKEQAAARQERLQRTMMEAFSKHKSEQAKALADVNKRAQMGQVQALQQQRMEAEAQGLPPEQKMLGEMAGVLSRIDDPEARALGAKEFGNLLTGIKAEKQKQAAMKTIETSVADGHVEQELMEQRLAAGEEPETIAKELGQLRMKRAEENLATQESQEAIERAQALIEAIPPGTKSRQRAQIALQAFVDSPSAQKRRGAGQSMLKQVQNALVLEAGEEKEVKRQEIGPALPGVDALAQQMPPMPAPIKGAPKPQKRATPSQEEVIQAISGGANQVGADMLPGNQPYSPVNAPQQAAGASQQIVDLFHASKTSADFAKALNDAGIEKTPENRQFIAQLLQDMAGGAANR